MAKNHELPDHKPYLRADEVAAYLDLSKSTVLRLVKKGEIPAQRFGHSIRIRREDILRYAPGPEEAE